MELIVPREVTDQSLLSQEDGITGATPVMLHERVMICPNVKIQKREALE